jgi:hypothetical protein
MSSIDSLLNQAASKKNGRLTKIKIGSRRTGTAFFYLKSNNALFTIADRKSYFGSSHKNIDSASEYKYFFLNDKLVKVIHSRTKSNPFRAGYTYLYFKDNSLLGRKEFEDYPITNTEFVLNEALLLLSKAKNIVSNKN